MSDVVNTLEETEAKKKAMQNKAEVSNSLTKMALEHIKKRKINEFKPFSYLALPSGECIKSDAFSKFYQDGNKLVQKPFEDSWNYEILDSKNNVVKKQMHPKDLVEFINHYYK